MSSRVLLEQSLVSILIHKQFFYLYVLVILEAWTNKRSTKMSPFNPLNYFFSLILIFDILSSEDEKETEEMTKRNKLQ